jgi:hypothetical protein
MPPRTPGRSLLRPASPLALAVAVFAAPPSVFGCTTAVISGAATADGRPILWKNRDADNLANQLVYNDDGRHAFVGLIDTGDAAGMKIWAGVNDAGFAIMNSASYNIEEDDEEADGELMRLALQSCASLAEFQALLERTNPGGRAVASNFGVIDAKGGAAYFETSRKAYKRFDATDPALAPRGLLVRSNFSDSGDDQRGSGTLRRRRASALLEASAAARTLDAPSLLSTIARDVANEALGSDPLGAAPAPGPYAYIGDSICRDATAAAVVIAGVKPGENPLLATAWVILGQPITGVAVPAWVAAKSVPAELAVSPEPAPLTRAFDAVKALFFPATRGELKRFASVEALRANDRRVVEGLLAIERKNVLAAGEALAGWRRVRPAPEAVRAVQDGIARRTLEETKALLPK